MKWKEAEKVFDKQIVLSLNDFLKIDKNFDRKKLYERKKRWLILKVRNWFYIKKQNLYNRYIFFIIANKIYQPSYISLEMALHYYCLIPEYVTVFTSITTKPSKFFEWEIWYFRYSSIKKDLFCWYKTMKVWNWKVNIATMEKALFDFIYLRPMYSDVEDFEELRIDTMIANEELDKQKLIEYWKMSWNKKCIKRIENFIIYLERNA